jgi:multiple sugar transport system ATP-binding protein
MKLGEEQQKDEPQNVYLKPKNRFVAEFLGNPPINIVSGEIKKNHLYIGGEKFAAKKAKDGVYDIGLRPEDFKLTTTEGLEVENPEIDTIGRDTMIRFDINGIPIRALVDSESYYEVEDVILTMRENKILLFDPESGEVI